MLKVLFVSDSASLGGAPKVMLDLVRHFDRSRLTPMVALGGRGPAGPAFSEIAPTFSFRYPIPIPKTWRVQLLLRSWIKKVWFRHVVTQVRPGIIYYNSVGGEDLLGWVAGLKLPRIMHVHGVGAEHMFTRTYQDLIATAADRYICCAQAVAHHMQVCLGVDPRKLCTIYAGVDVRAIATATAESSISKRVQLGVGADDLLIGGAGYFQYIKGVDLFIEAAALIQERFKDRRIRFMWIGGYNLNQDTYSRSVIRHTDRLGLTDKVLFVGHQTHIYDYLNLLDMFVMCSRQEAFPLVVVEAMALQKPVVAFPVGGVPEALQNGAGLVTERTTPEALADAVSAVIEDRELMQSLAQAGLQRVRECFDVTRNVRLFEDAILELASGWCS